jgi:hypothetical protein
MLATTMKRNQTHFDIMVFNMWFYDIERFSNHLLAFAVLASALDRCSPLESAKHQ